jgi:hypothetical protein
LARLGCFLQVMFILNCTLDTPDSHAIPMLIWRAWRFGSWHFHFQFFKIRPKYWDFFPFFREKLHFLTKCYYRTNN